MNIKRYEQILKKYHIKKIKLISINDIIFDSRAVLKCRWGCDCSKIISVRCDNKNISIQERKDIINQYKKIFILHSNDAVELTRACLELEKILFLDGYYFAFTLRACNYCKECDIKKGLECKYPEKIRPCEEMFGINVFETVKKLDLPIKVLQNKEEEQNRYGFVLIE